MIYYIGLDWMGHSRFLVHIFPIALLGAILGYQGVFTCLKTLLIRRIFSILLIIMSIGSIIWFFGSVDDLRRPRIDRLALSLRSLGRSISVPFKACSNDALWHLPIGCTAGISDIGYFKFLTDVHVIDIGVGLTEPARNSRGEWCYGEEYIIQRICNIKPCALYVQTTSSGSYPYPREKAALESAIEMNYWLSHSLPLEKEPDLGNCYSVWLAPNLKWKGLCAHDVLQRTERVLKYVPYDRNALLNNKVAVNLTSTKSE